MDYEKDTIDLSFYNHKHTLSSEVYGSRAASYGTGIEDHDTGASAPSFRTQVQIDHCHDASGR